MCAPTVALTCALNVALVVACSFACGIACALSRARACLHLPVRSCVRSACCAVLIVVAHDFTRACVSAIVCSRMHYLWAQHGNRSRNDDEKGRGGKIDPY